ncbi:MAG: hypothetical protein AAGI28_01190 [Pseudomonadota bacterium]
MNEGQSHHNLLPKLINAGEWDKTNAILSSISDGAHSITLFSAEDFENCLGDPALAVRLEEAALACGFTQIEWHFVLRAPWTYFNSLYAEMSKQGVATSYQSMLHEVMKNGSYSCASGDMRWYFEFEYNASLRAFEAETRGALVLHDFHAFCRGGAGSSLLLSLAKEHCIDVLNAALAGAGSRIANNARADRYAVEFRYVCNQLALNHNSMRAMKFTLLLPIVSWRLWAKARAEKQLKEAFVKRFGANSGIA